MEWPKALEALHQGDPVYRDAWPVAYVEELHGQLRISRYGCAPEPWSPSAADLLAKDWRNGAGVHYLEPR